MIPPPPSGPVTIKIARGGAEIGEYDLEQVPDLLKTGVLRKSDHYWMTGMAGWGLLDQLVPSATVTHPEVKRPDAPELWNPNAAANWSLLFTPIFGAWLHARNWEVLGRPKDANRSMLWVYGGILFLLGTTFAPIPDAWIRVLMVAWLALWYFGFAKAQMKHVEAMQLNGATYEKKAWLKPLVAAAVALLIFIFSLGLLAQPTMTEILESQSVGLVTRIITEKSGGKERCTRVKITQTISEGRYRALAYLNDGKVLDVSLEVRGDEFYLEILPQ